MTLANLPATRYHQGWAYHEAPENGQRARWVATWRGKTVRASSEQGIKLQIDAAIERTDPLNTVN